MATTLFQPLPTAAQLKIEGHHICLHGTKYRYSVAALTGTVRRVVHACKAAQDIQVGFETLQLPEPKLIECGLLEIHLWPWSCK